MIRIRLNSKNRVNHTSNNKPANCVCKKLKRQAKLYISFAVYISFASILLIFKYCLKWIIRSLTIQRTKTLIHYRGLFLIARDLQLLEVTSPHLSLTSLIHERKFFTFAYTPGCLYSVFRSFKVFRLFNSLPGRIY